MSGIRYSEVTSDVVSIMADAAVVHDHLLLVDVAAGGAVHVVLLVKVPPLSTQNNAQISTVTGDVMIMANAQITTVTE
jgi:hypothetical protein